MVVRIISQNYMKKVIAINIGSRNKKYAYFEEGEEKSKSEFDITETESFRIFLESLQTDLSEMILGIRVVAPGKLFVENREIDNEYLEKLRESKNVAPLHTDLTIKEIDYIKNNFKDLKIFAVSDSSFHKSIGETAKIYAIPKNLREEYGIERQGYHGLSLSSVVNKINTEFGSVPEKMIVCHLGGGSSVTALRDGISVDTSMGWTPLEGVPMTERVGDIDPGIIAFLSEKLGKNGLELEKFLAEECGLEAISGVDKGDIQKLLEEEKNGNERAHLALDVYVYKIKKYIGAMSAVLGGCDLLVFTGTVGFRSAPIRERVVQNLEYLNLFVDTDKNNNTYEPQSIEFLNENRKVAVVPIDEMKEIAKAVEFCIGGR